MGFLERKTSRRIFLSTSLTAFAGITLTACTEKSKIAGNGTENSQSKTPENSNKNQDQSNRTETQMDSQEYAKLYEGRGYEQNKGLPMPDFEGTDLNGNSHRISEIKTQYSFISIGKIARQSEKYGDLGDYMTSPLIPRLLPAKEKYGDEIKIVILAGIDSEYNPSSQEVREIYSQKLNEEEKKIDFWTAPFSNIQNFIEETGNKGFPANFLLDKDKKILNLYVGINPPDFWLEFFRRTLEKGTPKP